MSRNRLWIAGVLFVASLIGLSCWYFDRKSDAIATDDPVPAGPRYTSDGAPLPDGAIARIGVGPNGDRHQFVGLVQQERVVVTHRGSRLLEFWDRDTGRLLRSSPMVAVVIGNPGEISPDGRLIAVNTPYSQKVDRVVVVRDVATGREVYRRPGEYQGTFDPTGRWLFSFTVKGDEITVSNAMTGEFLRSFPKPGGAGFLFSSDGEAFACTWQDHVKIYNSTTGELILDGQPLLREHLNVSITVPVYPGSERAPVDSLATFALGPGGRRLAVVTQRSGLDRPSTDRCLMFEIGEKKLLWEKEIVVAEPQPDLGLRRTVFREAATLFSPDGSILAVGGSQELTLRDAATGQELHRYAEHREKPVRFTRNGTRLITVDRHGSVWVWDATAR